MTLLHGQKIRRMKETVTPLSPAFDPPCQNHVTWSAPSNIALIKYWGKSGDQLPGNPSLSMTLDRTMTTTSVYYRILPGAGFSWHFYFDGRVERSFEKKLEIYLTKVRGLLPWMEHAEITINTCNSFPHSSGLASSASAMAALSLSLLSIEEEINLKKMPENEFRRKASVLARLGSGSASRSVYGGYVVWGRTGKISDSSDEYAVSLNEGLHPFFKNIHDAILIVNSKRKPVSSSEGHALMKHHPFADPRYRQAKVNMENMIEILRKGDQDKFIALTEAEALTLHALMMSSNPGYILLEPETLEIIRKVRQYREQTGRFIAFTLDAGPNVHVLYHDSDKHETEEFIGRELMKYCENQMFIPDRIGSGPLKI